MTDKEVNVVVKKDKLFKCNKDIFNPCKRVDPECPKETCEFKKLCASHIELAPNPAEYCYEEEFITISSKVKSLLFELPCSGNSKIVVSRCRQFECIKSCCPTPTAPVLRNDIFILDTTTETFTTPRITFSKANNCIPNVTVASGAILYTKFEGTPKDGQTIVKMSYGDQLQPVDFLTVVHGDQGNIMDFLGLISANNVTLRQGTSTMTLTPLFTSNTGEPRIGVSVSQNNLPPLTYYIPLVPTI